MYQRAFIREEVNEISEFRRQVYSFLTKYPESLPLVLEEVGKFTEHQAQAAHERECQLRNALTSAICLSSDPPKGFLLETIQKEICEALTDNDKVSPDTMCVVDKNFISNYKE